MDVVVLALEFAFIVLMPSDTVKGSPAYVDKFVSKAMDTVLPTAGMTNEAVVIGLQYGFDVIT